MLKDTDHGFASLLKALDGRKIPNLEVGVFGAAAEAPHGSGRATVGDVCAWMEHGTPTVPERPFISGWMDRHEADMAEVLKEGLIKAIRTVMPLTDALRSAGRFAVAGIKEEMIDTPPPLSITTFQKKGHDQTLVETGQLRDALAYRLTP